MKNINNPAKEQILEEAKIYCSLTNDLTDSWKKVLKWKRLSQAELSRRTGLSERTISEIINGKRIGSLENMVMMCLAAHIPGKISEHLLDRSGYSLIMSNEEQVIYNYLLWHMYSKDYSEIRQFLFDIETKNPYNGKTVDV